MYYSTKKPGTARRTTRSSSDFQVSKSGAGNSGTIGLGELSQRRDSEKNTVKRQRYSATLTPAPAAPFAGYRSTAATGPYPGARRRRAGPGAR
eukprot:692401-Hanusia_phi.AAC.1